MQENEETATAEVKTEEAVNPFSRVEEIHAAQKPLAETAENPVFANKPLFPEGTVFGDEVKEEVKTVNTEVTEGATVIEENKEAVVVNKDEPVIEANAPEVDLVGLLNTALDTETAISSVDDLKNIIEENKKFKAIEGQYRELSQEERARIEVGREFGDFGLYDRVMKIDTKSITSKEALRQVFILDNLDSNPQFLEKKFEKDYAKTYEEETDEDYSKLELENNGRKAIARLIDLQEDLKERGKISGGTDPEVERKAKEEADNKWFAGVDEVMKKAGKITYELEDEATKEKFEINIVMDAKDRQLIQDAMDSPINYLKSRITDEKGDWDYDALLEFIYRDVYYEKALDEARKSGAAVREESILKNKKQTVIESVKAGDAESKPDLLGQMAANWRNI